MPDLIELAGSFVVMPGLIRHSGTFPLHGVDPGFRRDDRHLVKNSPTPDLIDPQKPIKELSIF